MTKGQAMSWEESADWWQREFTDGADPEYEEQIIPLALDLLAGRSRIADIGTGEGQMARRLIDVDPAVKVVGLDPTVEQIVEAQRRAGGPAYARAGADSLPIATASCDGALACLVFEHIPEMDAAIREVARILAPGGRFVFMLNHPLLQTPGSGWIDDHMVDPPEQYWRIGPYLVETDTVEEVQKDVWIPFIHRPLHRYVNALVDAGLQLTRMLEPAPPPGYVNRDPMYGAQAHIPRLLVLVADQM